MNIRVKIAEKTLKSWFHLLRPSLCVPNAAVKKFNVVFLHLPLTAAVRLENVRLRRRVP